jgi:hypothetical protein
VEVIRFDAPGEVLEVVENADGSVSATATVARCGIYPYRRADGSTRRELVLPEHLFHPQSLATVANVALTRELPGGHPPAMLNPDNAAQYAKGHVHETVDAVEAPTEHDFGYARVRFTARVRDAVERVREAKAGKPLFTSPGYMLPQYDATPGVHPIWGAYDAIQGPRIYNHLALTDSPRGGPAMVVHMDGADVAEQERTDPASWAKDETKWAKAKALAEKAGRGSDYAYVTGIYKNMGGQIGDARTDGGSMTPVKIRLDGIGREVELDALSAEIVRQELARRDAEMETSKGALERYEALKAECDALKATIDAAVAAMEKEAEPAAEGAAPEKMDALPTDAGIGPRLGRLLSLSSRRDGRLAAERQARADAQKRADAAEAILSDRAKVRELLAPRVALETTARQVLATDQHGRIDGMGDDEIRRAVTSTLLPQVNLDGVSGDRLIGLFEGALATRQPRTDAGIPPRAPNAPDPKNATRPAGATSEAEAWKRRVDSDYQGAKRA